MQKFYGRINIWVKYIQFLKKNFRLSRKRFLSCIYASFAFHRQTLVVQFIADFVNKSYQKIQNQILERIFSPFLEICQDQALSVENLT